MKKKLTHFQQIIRMTGEEIEALTKTEGGHRCYFCDKVFPTLEASFPFNHYLECTMREARLREIHQ